MQSMNTIFKIFNDFVCLIPACETGGYKYQNSETEYEENYEICQMKEGTKKKF